MGNTDYKLHQAAYQAGLRASRNAANPFNDARRPSWDRGHRDRWLHNIRPDRHRGARSVLLAKLLLAAGASAIIYSFLNAPSGA